MIEITYEPEKYRLTLQGHAGAGVVGQDLICCAASALTYTAAANVRAMQKKGWLRKAQLRLQPGQGRIRCWPREGMESWVQTRLDALCLGYLMLSREYPDFVRFRLIQKEECNHDDKSA